MKKLWIYLGLITPIMLVFSSQVAAYDQALAESYGQYFAPFKGKATGKAMKQMPADKLVMAVRSGEAIQVIDIRTPAESGLTGFTIPGSMAIPLNELFNPKNLDLIPQDRPVVVSCKAGHRGMIASTALRHIGFKNVYNLKGGMMALTTHVTPKTAHVVKVAKKK